MAIGMPVEPMLSIHGEPITVLLPVTGESAVQVSGIVSMTSEIAEPALSTPVATVRVPAGSPLEAVGIGGRCVMRGREYGVRWLEAGDDAGWVRVHLA